MANITAERGVDRRERTLAPEAEPKRGPEHDKLSVFAGGWHAEGHSWGPSGEVEMVADETWEWLPGGFFLTCHFSSRAGETEHKGSGYLAYDMERGTHICRMIDNLGYDRLYTLSPNGRVWTFRGERERATYAFAEDDRSIDIRWEFTEDGLDWKPLCELKAVRTAGLGPTKH